MFSDRLFGRVKQKNNPSVLGLDPRPELIPRCLRQGSGTTEESIALSVKRFNRALIDALEDIIPAIKPQVAFYEALGIEGLKAYRDTIEYAQDKGLIVIGDIKRGDIASTAEAYRDAHFRGYFKCDAVTLNPFLGYDSLKPFIEACKEDGKGVFILVKTSNPSSGEFQNLIVDDEYLYMKLAKKVTEWGEGVIGELGYSSVGAVVGATYPEELKALRTVMPDTPILVPGYGAQGGTAADVAHAFNGDGLGAVVNSSRKIMGAYLNAGRNDGVTVEEFKEYARREALEMKRNITGEIERSKNMSIGKDD